MTFLGTCVKNQLANRGAQIRVLRVPEVLDIGPGYPSSLCEEHILSIYYILLINLDYFDKLLLDLQYKINKN